MPEGDTVWLAANRMNTALAGATVTEVVPRGKHMLTRFADGRTLRTHFRMDGSWHIYRKGTPWKGGPGHSIRAVLATDEWECVGYRLRAHPDEEIGVAVLDQRNLAGIGNLYKVESLFMTRTHPWIRVADVPDL